jgi:nitrite reductase (NO-forming)
MNNDNPNPEARWLGVLVILVAVLVTMILPVHIEVKPSTSQAQAPAGHEVSYTLRTVLGMDPVMAFIGVGGEIDGVINPTLTAEVGDQVSLTVINGDPVLHDLTIDAFGVSTGELTEKDQQVTLSFVVSQAGEFEYYCTVPGHREIGMKGQLLVSGEAVADGSEVVATPAPVADALAAGPSAQVAPARSDAVSIVHNPADVPPPVGDRGPMNVRVDLTAQEVVGVLADGATYTYFTFDGQVPGPMIRIRVGDTVELHLRTAEDSQLPHSIDLHAVTGPGGGAVYTQTAPGDETIFTFQALKSGLFVYHCATPSVAHHIANGMYGMILVEPPGGLPPVDREFYVMQGEIYTAQPYGTQGHLDFDHEAMLDEKPEYFVFNGSAGALTTDEFALHANVGETVRIFFGVGGPNFMSSFHVIGEIFDRVYDLASLTTPPMTDVQTTVVPPGGATMVELGVEVPGRYILVDHAISRLERGLAGYLYVDGPDAPEIYHDGPSGG